MKTLGTILPNSNTARADKYADQKKQTTLIAARVIFKGMIERFEDGEQRFYESCNRFNVLTQSGRRLKFEIRKNGTFAI